MQLWPDHKWHVFFNLRRFVDHVVQEVDSRFLQRHQGLIISADRLSMAMSIDTRDQIEILKYYKKFLTMLESS